MSGIKTRSPLWYELPLLFLVIGGVIAFFKIKKDDPKKAKNCLVLGIVLTIPFIIVMGVFIPLTLSSGLEKPFYVVASGSMEPTLNIYDIVIADNISFEDIQVNDVIVFSKPLGHDKVILQRVAEIIDDDPKTIRTKGDANPNSIPGTDFPITKEEYIGKIVNVIPQVGYITQLLKPPVNTIISITELGIWLIPIVLHFKFRRETKIGLQE